MQAGKLRKRIEVQTLTTSQDGYGEPIQTWTTSATVWGELVPSLRATREAFAGMSEQRVARLSIEVRLRWLEDVSPKSTRIRCEDVVYEVEAAMDPDGRTRELLLFCYRLE